MTKNMISKLNSIAQDDFPKAQAILDGINMVSEVEYGWLNKRVVFFDDKSTIHKMYATVHDAYAYAE